MVLTTLLATALGCSGNPSGPDGDEGDVGPVVTGAAPTTLPLDSTFNLRVFGSGFEPGSRVVLTLNGAPTPKVRTNATLFVSSQELTANITTAADAPGGPYDIEVDGRNGKQGIGTELVDLKAHVFGISPASTEAGEPVTISGINFGTDRGPVVVTFDGVGGFVQSVSNASIVAVVPPTLSPRTALVQVTIAGSPITPGVNLEVVVSRILITGIEPAAVARGEEVTISGSGFGRDRDQVHVTVGRAGDDCCHSPDDRHPALVLSVDDTILVAAVPLEVAIGTAPVEVSADRIPVPQPAQTVVEVLPRRPLTGTWTLSGDVRCCDFFSFDSQLGGSLTISERAGGGLTGSGSVRATSILGPRPLGTGPLIGTLSDGSRTVTFTVDSTCEFTGHLVTGKLMAGTLGSCRTAVGTWEATRQ
jgi:hypothetical protein